MSKLISGIPTIKHPRKGSPEKRQLWLSSASNRYCIAKKIVLKVSKKTKGWAFDDDVKVTKGCNSSVFERTIKKYGPIDEHCCLSIQLHERTLDLQFETSDAAELVHQVIIHHQHVRNSKVRSEPIVVEKSVEKMIQSMLKALKGRAKKHGRKLTQEEEITIHNEMTKSFDPNADKTQYNAQLKAIKKMSKNELNQTLGFFGV